MNAARTVFLSHTAELARLPAGRPFVGAAKDAVSRAGDIVGDMSYFPASETGPAAVSQGRVRAADVYVAIVGFRYGSAVRERPEVSYTELEFEEATDAGMPRLVFLLADAMDGPRELFAEFEHPKRQAAFRARLLRDSNITAATVSSPEELSEKLFQSLMSLQRARSVEMPVGRVWAVPAHTTMFIGRGDIISSLHEAFFSGRSTTVQAVHGMGGIGKTTLALEYAHRFGGEYDVVWWIPAEDPTLILDRMAELARSLGLANATDLASQAVERLLGALHSWERWLLVFDNADDPTALAHFLPSGAGHIVITSRNPNWGGFASSLAIETFTRVESVSLLCNRVQTLPQEVAIRIAEKLGDLPLAIAQAAAFLDETGMDPSSYVQMLDHRTNALLHRGQVVGYPSSLAASWSLAFDEIAADAPAAMTLLGISAHMAPEPIPLTLFTGHPNLLPEPLASTAADPLEIADLAALLRRRALARIDSNALQLHRIVQALLKARFNVSKSHSLRGVAIRLLRGAAPIDPWNNPGAWPTWRALLPHVLVVADSGPGTDSDGRDVLWMLNRAAIYLLTRGEPQAALAMLRNAHTQSRDRFGADDLDTLESQASLARALVELGEHQQARVHNEDALARRRRILGEGHPLTLESASRLARNLRDLGEHEKAERLNEGLWLHLRQSSGDDHPFTIKLGSCMARDQHAKGNYERARELNEEALRKRRRILGEDHPETLQSAYHLAQDLQALGLYERALMLDVETLAKMKQVLGDDHPDTLRSASSLAADHRALGQYSAARDLDSDVFERRRRVLADRHPETVLAAKNLILDLDKLSGQSVAARDLRRWIDAAE